MAKKLDIEKRQYGNNESLLPNKDREMEAIIKTEVERQAVSIERFLEFIKKDHPQVPTKDFVLVRQQEVKENVITTRWWVEIKV